MILYYVEAWHFEVCDAFALALLRRVPGVSKASLRLPKLLASPLQT